jgi:hypothetical protein
MRPVGWLVAGVALAGCAGPVGQPAVEGVARELEGAATSLEVAIAPGEARLVLHVTNTSGGPLAFTFPTSQRYDFEVEDPGGARVWRWSDEFVFLQVITEATLEPGETWTMSATWEPGDRAGPFVAVGRLVAMDRGVEERVTFELP